ncbi:16486_t:CDS:2, partial [Acaulospora colombiana]
MERNEGSETSQRRISSFDNCLRLLHHNTILRTDFKVDERKAKSWFESLASAVEFMHARGVAHNDIKPANILLSASKTPILVDFGFSERYELGSADAFRSSLAYGTPEYLSPERAKGQLHNTRKSDVWSLGVTFFEIIMARTPFENDK